MACSVCQSFTPFDLCKPCSQKTVKVASASESDVRAASRRLYIEDRATEGDEWAIRRCKREGWGGYGEDCDESVDEIRMETVTQARLMGASMSDALDDANHAVRSFRGRRY